MHLKKDAPLSISLYFSIIISLLYFLKYILSDPHPYTWPALDMAPLFLVRTNLTGLANDFFTQCSLIENPRHIFAGLVLTLSNTLNMDWFRVLFAIQTHAVTLIPVLIFASFFLASRRILEKDISIRFAIIFGFLTIVVFIFGPVSDLFTVAWWRPVYFQGTPHVASFLLGLISLLLSQTRNRFANYFSGPILLSSVLIHPSVGVATFVLQLIMFFPERRWGFSVWNSIFVALPLLMLFGIFDSAESLSSEEFVDIYVFQGHSRHYAPSSFESFHGAPWYWSVILVTGILLACTWVLFFAREQKAALLLGLLLSSYLAALGLQYVSTEVLPSRVVAAFGPSRFLMWGYWFSAFGAALALPHILQRSRLLSHGAEVIERHMAGCRIKRLAGVAIITVFIVPFIYQFLNKIDFSEKAKERNGDILTFIMSETADDSVFMAPHAGGLRLDVPIIAHRAIFHGNGFPFTEQCFREYRDRKALTDGSIEEVENLPGNWIGAKIMHFYESKPPPYFLDIGDHYTLDYVVVRPKHAQDLFKGIPRSYDDGKHVVFSIEEMRRHFSR